MRGVDRPCHLDERAAVARHLLCRVAVAFGEHHDARGENECGRHADDDPAREPVAGEQRDHEHGAEERDEARLRVGEVEAGRQQAQNGEADGWPQERKPESREDDDDAEDQVAPVDIRILEDGRHAEERRVRVGELDVLLGEDFRVRPGLVDADRGEHRRHRDEARRERTPRPVSWSGEGDDREENAERKVEEDELDRPRAGVLRPEQRDPRERDERRGGSGDQVGDGWELGASDDAVAEGRSSRREHDVEGEQQERLLASEPDRQTKRRGDEQRYGRGGRVANEDRGEPEREECPAGERAEPRRGGCQEARRVRDQGVREPGLGGNEGREPAEEKEAFACQQEPAGSEGPHHGCGVCQGLVVHGLRRSTYG
jgi:hypothetical protein